VKVQTIKVAFRVDASLQMGTGHVMRCLTLADALALQGGECQFICREHPGNLIEHIRSKGFQVHALPLRDSAGANLIAVNVPTAEPQLAHAAWLGSTQEKDAAECTAILSELIPDWLIVDHYALDARWETALKSHYRKLMVIDDLADRPHQCDLLLDQTFGRNAKDYAPWLPDACTLLCGSQYSLLRPEFADLRAYSLERRKKPQLEHLLITMGGVDKDNATGQVLEALKSTELPANCRITVVMGTTAPWLAEVRQLAEQMPWSTTVKVGVSNMAQLMAESDLAIGAAGATSWERCCLGLPTLMLVLADNQRTVAHSLEHASAVYLLQGPQEILDRLPHLLNRLVSSPAQRASMSQAASHIADGHGVATVIHHLEF
jgi:UDP-2,4-diacetamido-2,4,6-trideoxy-beta-L-altropyranose hydrolase